MARIGAVLDEDTTNIISGSIQTQVRDQLLGKRRTVTVESAPPELPPLPGDQSLAPVACTDQESVCVDPGKTKDEPREQQAVLVAKVEKRKRGRPKVYVDQAPPSSTERSKHSIKARAASGGKRVMLRMTPEAYEALRVIMAVTGNQQETAAINQAIVARKNELVRAVA